MRAHEIRSPKAPCVDSPCRFKHTYLCRYCGVPFDCDISSQVTVGSGVVLASATYPYHAETCADAAYREGDPMAIRLWVQRGPGIQGAMIPPEGGGPNV